MKGIVDESMRALLDVFVAAARDAQKQALTAWIDTAFNGGLVMPRQHVERLGLKQASTTQAVLADGHTAVSNLKCNRGSKNEPRKLV
jgi:predicted aspartyl protease